LVKTGSGAFHGVFREKPRSSRTGYKKWLGIVKSSKVAWDIFFGYVTYVPTKMTFFENIRDIRD